MEALKKGQFTKPVVAWVSGTCAKLFKSEVQFGHAGAKSGGDMESAQARRLGRAVLYWALPCGTPPGSLGTWPAQLAGSLQAAGASTPPPGTVSSCQGAGKERGCLLVRRVPAISATSWISRSSSHKGTKRAQGKNKALKEAGAVVPESFEGLEGAIRGVYKELVEQGTIIPAEEVEAPAMPLDLASAMKAGKACPGHAWRVHSGVKGLGSLVCRKGAQGPLDLASAMQAGKGGDRTAC